MLRIFEVGILAKIPTFIGPASTFGVFQVFLRVVPEIEKSRYQKCPFSGRSLRFAPLAYLGIAVPV